MAEAIVSRVCLTGACVGKESAPVLKWKGPTTLHTVSRLSSTPNLAACRPLSSSAWFGTHRKLRNCIRTHSATPTVSTSEFEVVAFADNPSSEEVPYVDEEGRAKTLKVSEGDGIRNTNEPAFTETRSFNESSEGVEVEKEAKMIRICDKLIDVFLVEKTNPEDWRIFLAFSKEWVNIRPYFFKRCKSQAAQTDNPKKMADLLKLARRMKEVNEDIMRHDQLLAQIEKSPTELEAIVARQRKDFTDEFFEHLRIRIQASLDDQNRREEIAAIAKRCLGIVQEHDNKVEDFVSLSSAQMKFDDIIKSPSREEAAKKIENLSKKGDLDSSLMLLITKAWAAAKESTLMKEEAKDTMLHLYNVARGNMSRLVPKDIRILRHLLSINDPQQRSAEMINAFTPGVELEGENMDNLYTTPEALLKWVQVLLDAFHTNRKGTLIKEAQKLIQPSVISRLKDIKKELESKFM